eukprot:TRINITY_DN2773_c0_g1_i11.p1 TRINITY_DN2773_c0_g1~~TRINITY_DN2773_c0_g1_i11.p1  ORF type:complete len:219 (+),score=42.71 TRINITY_DN2773_c0_g1_i11:172-828(+)
MEYRFSEVPGEILDLIFLDCDLKDTSSLSLVCKKFHSRMNTEKMWKERSFAMWNEIVPYPTSNLEYIKEKVKMLNWKKITKFLSGTKNRNYRYEWDNGSCTLNLKRYKGEQFIPTKSVTVDFDSGVRYIRYGEYMANGNGHGISHRREGTYNGQWDGYQRHGQGKMMWLDGYEYEGEWIDDHPKDEKNWIHPKIVECLERKICTREAVSYTHLTLPTT